MLPTGMRLVPLQEIGSGLRTRVGCGALQPLICFEKAAGKLSFASHWHADSKPLDSLHDPSLAPLVFLALLPRVLSWTPSLFIATESELSNDCDGVSHGDGSGNFGDQRHARVVAWAVVRLRWTNDRDPIYLQ